MKFQFTRKPYQTNAVKAVCSCFEGQPKQEGISYRLDPGTQSQTQKQAELTLDTSAFRNAPLVLSNEEVLENIKNTQKSQNLPLSSELVSTNHSQINLDVEMETGTGKTYVFIKTIFEMNRRYGWSKFIIVVPSIAIREGIQKSLEITAEHFLEDYQKRARFFTYNSKELHNLESYSSDAGINVMIINTQAFNAPPAAGASDRTVLNQKNKIYRELDEFQSRRPIDIIKANNPILILDEPQRMEGKATQSALSQLNPLFVLRYSATHRESRNLVHRLDALDAYNQKLVKKITVHGIAQSGRAGASSYLYLDGIITSRNKPPVARLEFDIQTASGAISRKLRNLSVGDNLFELSGELNQYDGFTVSDINAVSNTVRFTNGVELEVGVSQGDLGEAALRRIQIREAIRAHFTKERDLYHRGIKVLTLFFIDEVKKYRDYDDNGEKLKGEYINIFEEEYNHILNEFIELEDTPFKQYISKIDVKDTHNGYFSVDKKSGQLRNPSVYGRGDEAGNANDESAYNLIMKDKERLLSFTEPTRFIFSHSALREGWDNPNVFVVCPLKHTDNNVTRRQEVGRGMRLCVNQNGERFDNPANTHDFNQLTVIANESYDDFVTGLQSEIRKGLNRPRKASQLYFTGKIVQDGEGNPLELDESLAKKVHRYLIKNDYINDEDEISEAYYEAKENDLLPAMAEELVPYTESIFKLIDALYSDEAMPDFSDGRKQRENRLNENFHKKEFQTLWNKINHRAAYTVEFDSAELIQKSIEAINGKLFVNKVSFRITRGQQSDTLDQDQLENHDGFTVMESNTAGYNTKIVSTVSYDLVGEISRNTQLTRSSAGTILQKINPSKFTLFQQNPEDFITKVSKLIKEQKATMIVEKITYNSIGEHYDAEIFTHAQADLDKAFQAKNHVFDYVVTDSKTERKFVEELDTSKEVTVYAKLPRGFSIPTPVGDYNPDWAIAFEDGAVKHLYFIAETKGSMNSMELRDIEKSKISCAKKFFQEITNDAVKYDVVDSYENLMGIIR